MLWAKCDHLLKQFHAAGESAQIPLIQTESMSPASKMECLLSQFAIRVAHDFK